MDMREIYLHHFTGYFINTLITHKVHYHLYKTGWMQITQFGFTLGQSTIDSMNKVQTIYGHEINMSTSFLWILSVHLIIYSS